MLRRGITDRSPSVCAFCQLRISSRRTRLPPQRFLSSTRALRENGSGIPGQSSSSQPANILGGNAGGGGGGGSPGWGKPLFASSPAVARPTEPTSSAPPASPQTIELLPHEVEARKRMAASRVEADRAEKARAAAAPKPGQGFRHSWNPQKQQEIKEYVQREDKETRDTNMAPSEYRRMQRHDPKWEPKKSYLERPATLTGRGYSTPPVMSHQSETKSNFRERGLAPFPRERRPPRALPLQTVGSGIFTPQKPLIQKTPGGSVGSERQPLRPSPQSASLGSNEIQTPHLTRLLDSESFFEKPKNANSSQSDSFFDAIRNDIDSKILPKGSSNSWDSGLSSRDRLPSQSRGKDTPQRSTNWSARNPSTDSLGSTWDSLAQNQHTESPQNAGESKYSSSSTGSSWSSLTRKQQRPSVDSTDFWTKIKEDTTQTSRNTKGPPSKSKGATQPLAADWGTEFDAPQVRRQIQARSANISRPEVSRGSRNASATESRSTVGRRTKDPESFNHDVSIPSVPAIPAGGYNYEDRRGRRREPNRNSRFETEDAGTRKTAKKRGGRNSRFEADEDGDDGMDDVYEDYVDRRKKKAERKAQREAERTEPQKITLPELISISNLAAALKIEKVLFLDQLAELGFEGISLDSIMAGETAALVAQEYGFEPTVETGDEHDLKVRPPPEDPSILPPRPPVVTIMGHVDHGKTTLLDYLRKSSVAAGEHGGITQHIGAFSVSMSSGKQITFLDTPGHAAFLSMRQRGANVTDIVVLVVAADDSVKPQTLEAIKHARQSKVPIIVAISKVDKEGAQIDRVKADLATNGVEIEDYGGDVQVVCVSGKTGDGMDDLEENILTLSEILDMRAETDGPAEGWILESSLKPIGKVATILVKRGTLRPGDFIAAGTTYAKIRHLRNEAGQEIAEALPGTPVEILGWRDLPAAGDEVIQGEDERRVRMAAEYRESIRDREQDAAAHEKISEQRRLVSEQRKVEKAAETGKHKRTDGSWGTQEVLNDTENGAKMVNFVIKGDVHGSVEACTAAILEIGSNEVRPRVLLASPGAITESDVDHAATSNSAIVNFNLPVSGLMKRQAELAGVKILDHTVIYHLTDDVKDYLGGYLGVDISYKVLGEAEIQEIFPINIKGRKYKNIAGCRIRNGQVERNNLLRVMRRGEKIFEGKLESFKHVRKDIDEARKGTECGIGFEEFQDLEVGDQIQAIEEVQTKRTL